MLGMSEIDYAARVQRGAALLDEKWPTWAQDIDLDRLDIQEGDNCMTAQYAQMLGLADRSDDTAYEDGQQSLGLDDGQYEGHGFNAEGASYCDLQTDMVGYSTLNRLWRDLIIQRREAAQPPEASER